MADTKLSALTELATTPASDDEVYIRDVSEPAATESKRITVANLTAAGATLTLSGAEVFNSISPTSWTDLDLSGTIGTNVALVILKLITTSGAKVVAFRTNGDTDEFYAANIIHGVALVDTISSTHAVVIVVSDASGIIEWKSETGDTTKVVDVIAYIK